MFVYARIIGVLTYTIILLMLVALIKRTVNTKFLLVVYIVLLAIMAFNYKPYLTADLYRLYKQVDIYGAMSMTKFWDALISTNTPTWLIYCKIIYSTGIRELLPTSAAVIFFGNTFYIIYKSSKKYGLSNTYIALLVFFEMAFGQYIQVISGIRSLVAFSVFAKCLYDEFFEEKSFIKHIWLYIIFALLHVSGVVVLAIRVLYEIIRPDSKSVKGLVKRIILIGLVLLVLGGYGLSYFQSASNIATQYITSDSYSYFWEYLLTGIHLAMIVYILKSNWYIVKVQQIISYVRFVLIFLVAVIIFSFEYSTFQRFSVFISVMSLPIIASIIEYQENFENGGSKTYNLMLMGSLVCLVLAVTRGNLCALKFFE